ncbi:MAG TPA: hypothetical protein PKC21_01370 [Oligoflexia bacterium]|nr:hypothetical protein [Oligoflexia bacterium]HMR23980.1 hypothetical protein [Oligoflexia bacterium]
MKVIKVLSLMMGLGLSGVYLSSCGESNISTLSADSYVSYYDPSEISAYYTINDGFSPYTRQAAVIIRFSKDGQMLRYDEGTKIYANGIELPFIAEGYMRYSKFIPLDDNATTITITTVKSNGSINNEVIVLAERVQLTQYNHNDMAPDLLSNTLTLNYLPAVNTDTNINVGGGECSNHYDTPSESQGSVSFNSNDLNEQDLSNYISGERIHFRIRNQKMMAPPEGFSNGHIESNGFTTFDLIVP